eukprot:TRINITY_DN2323_c0_g1_i5.p1 TRINITY_DN2323_c0_g1~~TRINITY_DN2323_c0_g1_i5.p1  ORF type:complete len:451 (-),score=71.07 TRINITY_DN2323_c0_g1_i5:402-1754(-)
MSSSSPPYMSFEYPTQFTVLSSSEHLQFLHFVQQQIFSNALFESHNERTLPEINGRSTDEIIAHAKVWINSLINSVSSPSIKQPVITNSPSTDNNNNRASSAISNDETTKRRKLETNVVQTPQYALDLLPYHVLQDIRDYLPLPYSYFFRITCKKLYFIDKATKSDRSKESKRDRWQEEWGWRERISPTKCCAELASHGYLSCLKFVRERQKPLDWDWQTTCKAAEGGHTECLKYALENDCEQYWSLFSIAAETGNLEMLKCLHEQGLKWDRETCSKVASKGHLECLKFLHENGCVWDQSTTCLAASGGHLECLKYAHENGCEIDSFALTFSLGHGHLECLKYVFDQGVKLQLIGIYMTSFTTFDQECMKYFCERVDNEIIAELFRKVFEAGSLPHVKFLVESNYPVPVLIDHGLNTKHIECLKYLQSKGCPLNERHLSFLETAEGEQNQ